MSDTPALPLSMLAVVSTLSGTIGGVCLLANGVIVPGAILVGAGMIAFAVLALVEVTYGK